MASATSTYPYNPSLLGTQSQYYTPGFAPASAWNRSLGELVLAEVRFEILPRRRWAARCIGSHRKAVERSLRHCWRSIRGSPRTERDQSAGFCSVRRGLAGTKQRLRLLDAVIYLPISFGSWLVKRLVQVVVIVPIEPYAAISVLGFAQI